MAADRRERGAPASSWPVRLWHDLVFLLRVLWVCRVSVASAFGGLALLEGVVQAQNLLADTTFDHGWVSATRHWTFFFFGLFFLWAFPVHYAARRTLDEDAWIATAALRRHLSWYQLDRLIVETRARHPWIITAVPRILGLVPFAAVALGLRGAFSAAHGARGLAAGADGLFLLRVLGVLDAIAAGLFLVFIINRRDLVQRAVRRMNRRRGPSTGVDPGTRAFARVSAISLGATTLIFVLAYLAPIWIGALTPRAALVPLLFGSLVLFLGWVVRMSYRHGFPYLLLLIALAAGITGTNTGFNDLRGIEQGKDEHHAGRQIDIGAAITRWQAANGCAADKARCPPALLVAADGGASRAAFMTASVVGEILDRVAGAREGLPGAPAASIFALSGVSGGAFGTAVIRAALADAAERDGTPPCHNVHRTWYRAPLHTDPTERYSWRDCLQSLVSGDFLSPVFVGLAFRDNLAPPTSLISNRLRIDDRAVLLEQAWERHYDYIVNGGSSILETGRPCSRSSENRGLCRRLGYLDVAAGGTTWLPLLALNGTSVQTGRRIVTTDLLSTAGVPGQCPEALYPQAYDLFEMRSTGYLARAHDDAHDQACGGAVGPLDAPDILLSTAALTSARFPIISPAGAIWTRNADRHGDRIVDGGYFENSGLTTALDIARALHERGLVPIVLTISNEPESVDPTVERPPRPAATPDVGLSKVAGPGGLLNRTLGIVSAPIQTLLQTRDGHGAEARDTAVRMLESYRPLSNTGGAPAGIVYFHVGMSTTAQPLGSAASSPTDRARCAELKTPIAMTKVSMSWWLSPAVQADIDAQLCTTDNQNTLTALIQRIAAR